MLNFIQELTEARMYRGTDTLSGKSADEIAEIVYVMFLVLEILRKEDPSKAFSYAKETTYYTDFATMRNGSSDLHNLLAVLSNQERYEDKIKTSGYISVPMMQTKKYFRDFENRRYDPSIVRTFILRLEGFLNIRESWMKQARRTILFWDISSDGEKQKIKQQIRNFFQRTSFNNDLYVYYKNNL